MKKNVLTIVLITLLFSTNALAQRTNDIKGGKDYPLVSRFEGSFIAWNQVKNFDRYFMLSLKDNKLDRYEIDGKITRIQYESQKEHSVFEIYKSYENALKNAGFKILLTLDKTNCGLNLTEQLYSREFNGLNVLTDPKSISTSYREGQFAYLSAKKKIDDKDIYIVIFVSDDDYPIITFDAIEVQSMDKGLVSIKDLETDISQNGHIAIYDIHFDTGKTVIKPESEDIMNNIATYLKAHSDKKYVIVGHTDNVGDFDANMKLSLARAQAVVKELIEKYVIDPAQLKAYGDGQTAPVATNATKEGRAKNRRVEIVLM